MRREPERGSGEEQTGTGESGASSETSLESGYWVNSEGKFVSNNYTVDKNLGQCCYWSEFGNEVAEATH